MGPAPPLSRRQSCSTVITILLSRMMESRWCDDIPVWWETLGCVFMRPVPANAPGLRWLGWAVMRLIISVGLSPPAPPAYISLSPDDLLCLLSTFFMSLQIMIVSVSPPWPASHLQRVSQQWAGSNTASSHLLVHHDVCEAICTPMSIPPGSVVMSQVSSLRVTGAAPPDSRSEDYCRV